MRGKYPSVTEVLADVGLGPDFSGIPHAVMEAARVRGSAVHAAIEQHHYTGEFGIEPEYAPYMDGYLKFLADTGQQPILTEYEIVNDQWRVMGHLDHIGWMNTNWRTLIDFKTGDTLDIEPVRYQVGGYLFLWQQHHPKEPIRGAFALLLRGDSSYRLLPIANPAEAGSVFQAAVMVYHAQRR